MDASMPSFMMRASYADSPNKKLESLEKVRALNSLSCFSTQLKSFRFFIQIGHLAKLGGKLKTWRKRWFVLKNGSLTYWKSQNDVNRCVFRSKFFGTQKKTSSLTSENLRDKLSWTICVESFGLKERQRSKSIRERKFTT